MQWMSHLEVSMSLCLKISCCRCWSALNQAEEEQREPRAFTVLWRGPSSFSDSVTSEIYTW